MLDPWHKKAVSAFWQSIDWWSRHQKEMWVGLCLFLGVWMAYDVGRVVTRASLISMGGPLQGSMTVAQLTAHVVAVPGGRLLITGDNTARLIDASGKVWEISNFGDSFSRSTLKTLKNNAVSVEGDATVAIHPIKVTPGDLVISALVDIAVKLIFVAFYVGLAFAFFRMVNHSGKRFNSIGKDRRPQTRIADVAGHAGPKREVLEIVEYLRDPSVFDRAGAKPPGGVLLFGPPGNGKTMLAKAIAGEASATFLEQSASSFIEIYAGAGAKSVRSLFATARKNRPCVIFIDEIDAMGASRSAQGSHDERIQCLNALLSEMDGFEDNSGIAVIAATNRADVLDDALLRPGRFDRKVHVPLPGRTDRLEILIAHAKRLPLVTANLAQWADQTKGFSGADLAGLVNEAAVESARLKLREVSDAQFAAARDRILMGARDHGRSPNQRDREFVAYHEAGHALMRLVTGGRVEKVSILPRSSGALGATVNITEEENLLVTSSEVRQQLLVLMGGRAAEQVFFSTVTGGAADDMERASHLAREAVHRYGFDGLGPYVPKHEALLKEVESVAAQWVREAYDEAVQCVSTHRHQVDTLALLVLEHEEVGEEDIISSLSPVTVRESVSTRRAPSDPPASTQSASMQSKGS